MASKSYFLITLGPGLTAASEGRIIVLETPGFRIVDSLCRDNGYYAQTHKGIVGASLTPHHATADFVATTEAEVLLGKLAPLSITQATTECVFNDVHHAAMGKEYIAVANSGCDCVDLLTPDLTYVRSVPLVPLFKPSIGYTLSVLREQANRSMRRLTNNKASYSHLPKKKPWSNLVKAFRPHAIPKIGVDMRQSDSRPHFLHPNHVWAQGDDFLITLFRPGVQIRLSDGAVSTNGLSKPHDGVIDEGELLFTECVKGTVVIHDSKQQARRIEVIPEGKKGFVRGLAARHGSLYVGLSALRSATSHPFARVAVVDRRSGLLQDCWEIPDAFGRQVFSILDVTDFYA